jgi:hypothetical protein
MLGLLEWRWWGGIYSPQPPIQPLGQAAVDGRTGQSGAPLDIVRCATHVTQPLGFWRFRPLELCLLVAPDSSVPHRTVPVHYPVRLLAVALTLRELSAHCNTFAGVRCSRPLRWSRCSAGAPNSPVNYSGAALLKPEGGKFKLVRLWAPDTVRCARPGFSSVSFCSFFLNPNLIFLLVCVEPLAPVEYII